MRTTILKRVGSRSWGYFFCGLLLFYSFGWLAALYSWWCLIFCGHILNGSCSLFKLSLLLFGRLLS